MRSNTWDFKSKTPDEQTGLFFDLQRFAEGEGDNSGGESGGDTGFEFIHPQTKQKVVLPSKIGEVETKSFIEAVIAKSRTDVKSQLSKEYEPLMKEVEQYKDNNAKLQEMLDKFENEKLTAEERTLKERKRFEDEAKSKVESAMNEASFFKSMFKSTIEQNQILGEFSGREDVYRPDQAYKLMKAEFPIEVVEEDDNGKKRYRTIVKLPNTDGTLEDLDPKTAVERWLAMPEHNHFLKSNLQPGSGSSSAGGRRNATGALVYKRSQMHDPKVRQEVTEKMRSGEAVELIDG